MPDRSAPRVLFVIGQLGRGGAERQLYHLCCGLRGERSVVSLSEGGHFAGALRRAGVRVTELPRRGRAEWRRLRALVRLLRSERPDVVHVFTDNVAGLYPRLACLGVRPRALVIGERQQTAAQPRWWQRAKRLLNRRADAVVTNSASNLAWLTAHRMAAPERLHFVPNGIDLERFAAAPPFAWDPARRAGRAVVGTVANLTPAKRPEAFLALAAALAPRGDALFLHVGDGPLRSRLEREAAERGLRDRLVHLGAREDVPAFLCALDVFVLASASEGMPNALMEAMAAGRACVATDVGDCGRLVEDGKTGFLVSPRDPAALVERVERLLGDAALRRRLGFAAHERSRGFGLPEMVARYDALYRALCSRATPR